tara:strand:+ start:86 stop:385 length:300 start_codon:yes stop_codon:yes gene_type:complete
MSFFRFDVNEFEVIGIVDGYICYKFSCSKDGGLVEVSTKFKCSCLLSYYECFSGCINPVAVIDYLSKLSCEDAVCMKILAGEISLKNIENLIKITVPTI